jgi:hypothetical protein
VRLDLDMAKFKLDSSVQDFNQWYKQRQLEIQRFNSQTRAQSLKLAEAKFKSAQLDVKRPDINKIFNNVDSMFSQNSSQEKRKVTSQNYTFYGQNTVPANVTAAPVKSFVVRGNSFEDAFRKAQAKAISAGYAIPADWKQNVGEPGTNGYGPAFREERSDAKTDTITIKTPKYTVDQILRTNIIRLRNMGLSYNDANGIIRNYVESLVPGRQLDNWFRAYWAK